jgi:16S rRNA G966 N2-methylase RsmD
MDEPAPDRPRGDKLDRSLLLGERRNDLLTLHEVERYGRENFGDPGYVSLYGLRPADWYARGVRIAGRTAVECTRDRLGDLIGRDIASLAERNFADVALVADLFAGSGNTLFWINHHTRASRAVGFERDDTAFALADANLRLVGANVELLHESYGTGLPALRVPADGPVVVFVAPPWGGALSAEAGLDLRATTPPAAEVLRFCAQALGSRPVLFAVQVFERVEQDSLADVTALLDRWELMIYDLDAAGHNHGVLLGTSYWSLA